MRNKVFMLTLILLILIIQNSFSQNILIIENEIEFNYFISIKNSIEEKKIEEQQKILSYDDLPGTFWVMDEPVVIDEANYFFLGYIFLEDNWILEVKVTDRTPLIKYMGNILQLPYRNLYIIPVFRAMKYEIINGKIIYDNEIFAYLEDTNLYIYSIINEEFDEGYKKYRLEASFSIHDFTTE